jgi:hypothetical protein
MHAARFGIAVVLLTTSCEDACWQDDYDFEWEGEYVTAYGYGYTEADVCGGSFAELDGHTAMIRAELGVEDAPPSVFRWLSPDFFESERPCPYDSAGCAPLDGAVAQTLPNMHEVTHTLTQHISSDGCPRLLDEGLAMRYYIYEPWEVLAPTWGDATMSLREAMEIGFEWTGTYYAHAARFVSFLVETYGLESIVQLCEVLPMEPRLATWDDAVRNIYGITLEQLLADYDEYPECSFSQMRARLWGCSGPPDFTFPADGNEYVVEAGCEDLQATNAAFWTGDAILLRRVYVQEGMLIRISASSLGTSGTAATYMVSECAPCSEDPGVDVEISDDSYDLLFLPAGMHEVSVFFDKRDQVRLMIGAA